MFGTICVSIYFAGIIYLCFENMFVKKMENISFLIINGLIGMTSSLLLLGIFTGFVTVK